MYEVNTTECFINFHSFEFYICVCVFMAYYYYHYHAVIFVCNLVIVNYYLIAYEGMSRTVIDRTPAFMELKKTCMTD